MPNLVVVGIGTGGRVSVFNAAGSSHVLADVVGYFAPSGGSLYAPMPATRVYDTRLIWGIGGPGAPLGPGETRQVNLGGASLPALPWTATAVVVNVTVAFPTAPGYLTVQPTGVPRPNSSNLNFVPGQVVANLVVVGLGPHGGIAFFNAVGGVHVIVDIVGYMAAP